MCSSLRTGPNKNKRVKKLINIIFKTAYRSSRADTYKLFSDFSKSFDSLLVGLVNSSFVFAAGGSLGTAHCVTIVILVEALVFIPCLAVGPVKLGMFSV